jgi:hypothetical protein
MGDTPWNKAVAAEKRGKSLFKTIASSPARFYDYTYKGRKVGTCLCRAGFSGLFQYFLP